MANTPNLVDANGNALTDGQGNPLPGVTAAQISAAANVPITPAGAAGGAFSGLASLLGGQLLGPATTNPNFSNAVGTLQQAQNQINSNMTPTTAEMQQLPEMESVQGTLSPTTATAATAGPNALGNISVNPDITNSGFSTLGQLQDLISNGGLTPAMQSQIALQAQQSAAQARGANAATMQQAQERGMGNAGMTFLGQLQANQDEAQNNYIQGLGTAAQGQANTMNALSMLPSIQQQLWNQSYTPQLAAGTAQNAIQQFNAQNAQQTGLANAAAETGAQAGNVGLAQGVANTNVGATNTAQAANAQLPQTQFTDQTQTNALNANAANNTAKAQQGLGTAQTTASGNATNSLSQLFGNPNTTGSISNSVGSGLSGLFNA